MVGLGAAGLFTGARVGHRKLARAGERTGPLSDAVRALVEKAWQGLNPNKVLDMHCHVVGLGVGGTGCYVGPRMTALTSPLDALKMSLYQAASGVTDAERADAQYIERLTGLIRSQTPHGRLLLLAFEQHHDDAGRPVRELSEFHTPNTWVEKLARDAPDIFLVGASIHPYRPDAVDELERSVAAGALGVKWLPNAMNIDPSSEKCDRFYEALVRLKVPLITHAGEEKAVHAEESQRLGNPLLLRRALEHGVTTVVAHCASLGTNPDLDAAAGAPWVDNFELFLRLMAEPRWKGLLFGDTSALPIVTRVGHPLRTVLRDPALQDRLVNGSDYPLPAINVVMQTGAVLKEGFLTEAERDALNELDQHDPLLLDFVLKRTVRWKEGGREHRLSDAMFEARPEVFPRLFA
jgi:uncharacterized protein